jgi:voltage-gated potassium channel
MTSLKRIVRGFVILLIIMGFGTVGYMTLEGWSMLDALYMTVITITTVGFSEVRSVSPIGKVFTIFVIFFGVGLIAYILGISAQTMVESHIIGRTKLGIRIRSMKNHYIICGFGRIGRVIIRELKMNKVPTVVIDHNPEARESLESQSIPYIIADATSEEALLDAGIEKAKGVISVVASDADNLFITMTARGLNPDLFILTRADEEHTEKKMMRAGANRVVLPYIIGGQKMAHSIVKPAVMDFLEFTVENRDIGLEMGEIMVGANSRLREHTLMESGIRQELDVIIVAIKNKDGEMKFNPSSQTRIEAGDTLISLGKSDDLKKLSRILSG